MASRSDPNLAQLNAREPLVLAGWLNWVGLCHAVRGITLCEQRLAWRSAIWPYAIARFFKVRNKERADIGANEKHGDLVTSTPSRTADLVSRYMVLTKEIMPQMARDPSTRWPVRNDHCFQRIVLDNVCGGPWFAVLPRPAYKSLSRDQAARAVQLCEDIVANRVDLHELNRKSLIWRGKQAP